MKAPWWSIVVTRAACVVAAAAPALATCGSSNCFLVTDHREGLLPPGAWSLDLSFRYIDQSRKLASGDRASEVLTPEIDFEDEEVEPRHHREIETINRLAQLDLTYALSERLVLTGSLPIVNDRSHVHFDEVGTSSEHLTRGDGSSGFGDVQIGVRYLFLMRPRDLISGGLGLELPTGSYKQRDGTGEINEPTIQPGTGSTDAVASIHYSHRLLPGRTEWFIAGSFRVNAENDLGYRLGSERILNAGVGRGPRDGLGWSIQVNGRSTGRDEFLGERVPSTGALLVNVSPGVRFTLPSGASIYGHVQVPAYQHVNETQIAPRAALLVGISRTFSKPL